MAKQTVDHGAATAPRQPVAGLINLKNILFATDFSSCSQTVQSRIASLARRYEAKVLIAHVVSPRHYPPIPPEAEVLQERTWRDSRRHLEEIAKSKEMMDFPHEVLLGHGEVDKVLLEMIQAHDIDLVVVGTHGRRGLSRLALGSVAEGLIRNSPCPVLTCGPHVPDSESPEFQIHHVLLATDLPGISPAALSYALSFAVEFSARLTVLHVAPVSLLNRRQLQEDLQTRFRAVIPEDVAAWCEPEYVVEPGDPAGGILRVADNRQADVLVQSVRRARGWTSFHIGNILSTVLTQAKCPVLTVRSVQ